MPLHDWTRVDAGLFHHFHHQWIDALANALNAGRLPPEYFALVEQRVHGPIPDVLTLQLESGVDLKDNGNAGHVVATAPPRVQVVKRAVSVQYADRANRITVRHRHGNVVTVIEVVSPGNKSSQAECDAFVKKAAAFLLHDVNLLIIDVLPPGRRDPHGMARAVWDQIEEQNFDLPPDKPLVQGAFDACPMTAYFDAIAVGDPLPAMPLFLKPEFYVPAPLEESYLASWATFPAALKRLLEAPKP